MKSTLLTLIIMGFAFTARAAEETPELNDLKAKLSYGIGFNMGSSIQSKNIEVDEEILFRAISDALHQRDPLMTPQEIKTTLDNYRTEHYRRLNEQRLAQGEENKAAGAKFLQENKQKEGVVTLPSGLQYKVIKEGSGESPALTDTVKVNYRGRLIDGTEFDSSYKRGQPAKFQVNRVIKGWTEALQMMKPGAKWELYVPADLAYGERSTGSGIEPWSTLIFDVELLDVERSQAQPKPQSTRQPVTSDIIKVPSREELEKGAQIEIIKKEDLEKEIQKQRELQKQKEQGEKKEEEAQNKDPNNGN